MRALVTGAEGFIGRHLVELLRSGGYEVTASVQNREQGRGLEADGIVECDVRVIKEVCDAVGGSKPEVIYHLAAQSYPTVSWQKPQLTLETNVIGTANVFEAVLKHGLDPIIIVACSSAEYGYVSKKDVPVKETHGLEPLHPYGVSKVAADLLAYQYHRNNGLRTVRARIFNTTGPGKVKDVVSDFGKRVAECEAGRLDKVVHGNLKGMRDITDVRDMVRALRMCEKAKWGEAYNLSSMKDYVIGDLLDELVGMAGGRIRTEEDPRLFRTTDEPIIMGDNRKFRRKTGWKPRIRMEQTLKDTLDYWRERA